VTDLLLALAAIDPPNEPAITRTLGAPLQFDDDSDDYVSYHAKLESGPFAKAEVRLSTNEPAGIVSLWPAPETRVHEDDVDRTAFGDLVSLDSNPRIPPEGTVTYVHRVGKAKVNFQFRYASRVLYSASIIWEKEQTA
jgi:hypothetical protein